MPTEVHLPQWGMGMQEGTILQWLKDVGDSVEADEDLVEIETAKATEVMPAPVGGVLSEIRANPGDVVPVRAVIALIS
jgi:pyruvate/2-oxoglutarate dehydrogenase complex dihydrolipoamide acyltransferase (E2) component